MNLDELLREKILIARLHNALREIGVSTFDEDLEVIARRLQTEIARLDGRRPCGCSLVEAAT